MNIGLYGGTFNPPHLGHLIVAEQVRKSLSLDSIIFMPSYISPHKQQGESDLAEHRLAMTKLSIAGNPFFSCSDLEIRRTETSYSLHTLTELQQQYPMDKIHLIIGMDNYLTFHLWKEPGKILDMATLVVMNRPGYPPQVNQLVGTRNTIFIDVPDIAISSSQIRNLVKKGESIRYLVPTAVEDYIQSNRIFL
jgi:nicotinate-nucleotide adenylyltransferase